MIKKSNLLARLTDYLNSYCHFVESGVTLPLALWIIATYISDVFDAFPYLVITARTRRAGKTRLKELIGFCSQMPFPVAAASAPALYHILENDPCPTILWDEAETLSSESSNVVRALLNVGYRKGQTIPRASGGDIKQYNSYCPKVFVLIGSVYDTLMDRSIIIEMERANPGVLASKKRFSYETAKEEGINLAEEIKTWVNAHLERIQSAYLSETLGHLTDRDEEIWRALFAICRCFEPETYTALLRISADLAADKTNPHKFVESQADEARAQAEEYGLKLLRDAYLVSRVYMNAIPSATLLKLVRDLPTSPWRRYHSPSEIGHIGADADGSGLTIKQMAAMLDQFKVRPKVCRVGSAPTFRGYAVDKIADAAKQWKVMP